MRIDIQVVVNYKTQKKFPLAPHGSLGLDSLRLNKAFSLRRENIIISHS